MRMNRYSLVLLSVAAGIMSALAWSEWCSGLILLISFVPFLIIENYLYENKERFSRNAFFIIISPGFVIFNLLVIGWMRIASIAGAIAVVTGLSFLMSFTMWLAHIVRVKSGTIPGIVALVSFWLSFEYLSLNCSIVSPWLNLGNGLAKDILFIQWYEYTGVAGGTLWILISNILLSVLIIKSKKGRSVMALTIIWIVVIASLPLLSVSRYYSYKPSEREGSEVLIIQPGVDPYTERYIVPFKDQLNNAISLVKTGLTNQTRWIIMPETTIDDPVNLDDLFSNVYTNELKKLPDQYNQTAIVTGMVTYRFYPSDKPSPAKSATIIDASGSYYDHFNSALRIDTGKNIEVYHKSKLVPGIELQFSQGPGRLITTILPYLGGTRWGYGIQEERTLLSHPQLTYSIAPVICYESVFGSFVTDYIKKGAEAIFIITNDGWWKNTNGYKQHLWYASLRAIETRRPVARSANTGVSAIIDEKGKRIKETSWWTKDILKGKISPQSSLTFYVRFGDYILRISLLISLILFSAVFIAVPLRKKLGPQS